MPPVLKSGPHVQNVEHEKVVNMAGFSICESYATLWICQNISDGNEIRTYNYLACKRTLSHLAKLTYRVAIDSIWYYRFTLKLVRNMIITYSQMLKYALTMFWIYLRF